MDYPSLNKVFIVGRVEGEPQIKEISEGKEKLGFRVRTERKWRDRTFSTLHRVCVFGNMVGDLRGIREGDSVAVDGRIDNRKYEVNGETKWITELVANDVQVYAAPTTEAVDESDSEDALPF
jgi:single-strand DNA-binding protein